MIDWLSLIEQHNDFMLARELTEESRREYKEREQMARVIRELVNYIKSLEYQYVKKEDVIRVRSAVLKSSDAKELLDDLDK